MVNLLEISLISFITSFIFALGGLGSAVILIPILVFLGVPFLVARPAGLFTNSISTTFITIHNFRNKLINIKLAIPLVGGAVIASPVGACVSHFISEKIVGIFFVCFLFFAGIMVYIPKKHKFYKDPSSNLFIFTGLIAGFISGFLGVGGGGVISPLLITSGVNPKKVASFTAFAVAFSSFVGFLTYWKLGSVKWTITLSAGIPAAVAGYLAAFITNKYLAPAQVRKILGILFFILGIKFLLKFL